MNKFKFLTFTLATLTILSSCVQKDYYQTNLIKPEDFFAGEETKYGVYYYSENCPMCKESYPYIEKYLNKVERNSKNKELKNIYFIDAVTTPIEKYVESQDFNLFLETQIGVTNYKDVLQVGYPLLYIVGKIENVNTIIDIKIGKKALTDYISTIW